MENIVVRTKTTAKDYKKLVFFNTFLKKKIMMILTPVAGVISIAAIIGKSTGTIEISDWYYYVCLALLALIVLQYILYESSVKKFLKSDSLVVENERTVTVSESGIAEEGGIEKSSGEFQWEVFYQVFETKQYFYLYINTVQAIILPKRDFSGEQIDTLRSLLQANLENRFQKR